MGQKSWSPLSVSRVWQHIKLSDVSLGTRPQYSLVAEEDVKKPKKQIIYPMFFRLTPGVNQKKRFNFAEGDGIWIMQW